MPRSKSPSLLEDIDMDDLYRKFGIDFERPASPSPSVIIVSDKSEKTPTAAATRVSVRRESDASESSTDDDDGSDIVILEEISKVQQKQSQPVSVSSGTEGKPNKKSELSDASMETVSGSGKSGGIGRSRNLSAGNPAWWTNLDGTDRPQPRTDDRNRRGSMSDVEWLSSPVPTPPDVEFSRSGSAAGIDNDGFYDATVMNSSKSSTVTQLSSNGERGRNSQFVGSESKTEVNPTPSWMYTNDVYDDPSLSTSRKRGFETEGPRASKKHKTMQRQREIIVLDENCEQGEDCEPPLFTRNVEPESLRSPPQAAQANIRLEYSTQVETVRVETTSTFELARASTSLQRDLSRDDNRDSVRYQGRGQTNTKECSSSHDKPHGSERMTQSTKKEEGNSEIKGGDARRNSAGGSRNDGDRMRYRDTESNARARDVGEVRRDRHSSENETRRGFNLEKERPRHDDEDRRREDVRHHQRNDGDSGEEMERERAKTNLHYSQRSPRDRNHYEKRYYSKRYDRYNRYPHQRDGNGNYNQSERESSSWNSKGNHNSFSNHKSLIPDEGNINGPHYPRNVPYSTTIPPPLPTTSSACSSKATANMTATNATSGGNYRRFSDVPSIKTPVRPGTSESGRSTSNGIPFVATSQSSTNSPQTHQTSQLEKTRRILNNIKRCRVCSDGTTFNTRAEAILHLKKVHDMKLCSVCFMTLPIKGTALKEHFLKKHACGDKDEKAPCPVCLERFPFEGLYGHLSKKHLVPFEDDSNRRNGHKVADKYARKWNQSAANKSKPNQNRSFNHPKQSAFNYRNKDKPHYKVSNDDKVLHSLSQNSSSPATTNGSQSGSDNPEHNMAYASRKTSFKIPKKT